MNKIKLSIVEDHKILREGLCCLLNAIGEAEVISDFSNGAEFIESLGRTVPDIAIIDLCMPVMDGIETIKKARRIQPGLKILVLSMHSDKRYYQQVHKLNIEGYVLKSASYDELEYAITTIANGKKFFSQQLLVNLLKTSRSNNFIILSEQEQQILKMISQGFSTRDIALELNLSVGAIEKHRSKMLLQTGSSNSISLIVYAVKHNLIKFD